MEASGLPVLCSFHCVCIFNKHGKAVSRKNPEGLGGQGRTASISVWKFCPKGACSRIPREVGWEQAGKAATCSFSTWEQPHRPKGCFFIVPCVPSTLVAVSTEWQASRPSTFQIRERSPGERQKVAKLPWGKGIPERASGADAKAKNSPGWGKDVVGWGCGYPVVFFFLSRAPPDAFF